MGVTEAEHAGDTVPLEQAAPAELPSGQPPLVRSTVYVLRAVVGAALIALGLFLLLVFENGLLGFHEDIGTMQEGWPTWLGDAIEVTLGLGFAVTVIGTNAWLLWRRHFRRWVMINTAGIAAVFVGAVFTNLVLAISGSDALERAVSSSPTDEALGNDALASALAVLTVASVWIGPRLRPWVRGFVVVAVSFSFLPGSVSMVTLPLDVGVGILTGALVALVLRTRDRTPTAPELSGTLGRDGIAVASVQRASVDARGSVPWFVTTESGDELFVKTLTSDHRAADLLFRLYRMLRLRRAGDRRPASSLRRSVEHEAFLSLAAEARGIRTPSLVTVTDVGSDGMLLAYERLDGRSLDSLPPEAITDELLRQVWGLVGTLRSTAIAHRDLRLANVFVDADGAPWLIDFGFSELAADPSLLARDTAELLASTASVVGPQRAVAAAVDALGPDPVTEALPWIQPLALSSATRTGLGRSEEYERLRSVAAAAVGAEDVTYVRLERVKAGTVLTLVSVVLALYVLVPQLAAASGFFDELAGADVGWVMVVVMASVATYVGAGLGMVGAVPMRLPLGQMITAQLASSFSNRVTPAKVGGMATNVRFLQKQGIGVPVAASAVGLNTLAGTIVHLSLMALFALVASREVDVPVPDPRTAGIVAVALILASGLVMVLPVGRKLLTRYLLPALRAGASSIAAIARTPAKLLALFAGSSIVTLAYSAAMVASLKAFGSDLPLATVVIVYLAGAAVSSAAPTPGGIGAAEAALVAGYTAVGVDNSTAFAAVLLFRLVTFWLPILPGWLALVHLQRRGQL